MRRTIGTLGACVAALALATLAHSPMVGGTATMPVPACTVYESALLATSLDHGHPLRLACTDGKPV